MALKLSSQVGLRMGVQASGYAPVKGGASIYALKSKSGVLLTSKSGVFLTPKGA
jgi:hypothetical protein